MQQCIDFSGYLFKCVYTKYVWVHKLIVYIFEKDIYNDVSGIMILYWKITFNII
jgi:hypothetical protein